MKLIKFIFFICLLICVVPSNAQGVFQHLFDENYDSVYYDKLENKLTAKIFTLRKFSDFDLQDHMIGQTIEYRSNPRFSLGFGGVYKWLGLNIAIGMPNEYEANYDETRRIDLQTQINLRKLSLTFYGGRYRGYYVNNAYNLIEGIGPEEKYVRPDIKSQTYGLSGYYVFNSSRYSNKASFLHNEWQKKSAGSFLAGGSVFYNGVSADSSMVPNDIIYDSIFRGAKFDKTTYLGIGGHVGYGFTFVLWQHWFFDLSVLAGLSGGFTSAYLENETNNIQGKLGVTTSYRLGMGYNSERFYIGLNASNIRATMPLPIEESSIGHLSGIVRFIVAYRFDIKPHESVLPKWMPFEL